MKNKRRPRALLKGRSDRVQDNKPDDVKWYPADSQFFSAVSRKLGRGAGKLGQEQDRRPTLRIPLRGLSQIAAKRDQDYSGFR